MSKYEHDPMISESNIEWAIEQGACEDAIEWLRFSPRSIADVIETYPDWLLEHASDRLTDEQFAFAIAAEPEIALFYEHATDRMTGAQFAVAIAEKGTK